MKKIICTGDSHTWGQGASGLTDGFINPLMAGDLRLTNLTSKSYVNLLRDYINGATGSSACQYGVREAALLKGAGISASDENINIGRNGFLTLDLEKGLLRVQFPCGKQGGDFVVLQDGKETGRICTYSEQSENNYKILHINTDKSTNITIKPVGSALDIFKVETYTGAYGVINSGVGSTTTQRYLDQYWSKYVVPYEPVVVVMEAHSINDWANCVDPQTYYNNLLSLMERAKNMGAEVILLTVSPVLGAQTLKDSCYDQYINVSREVALKANVPVADANAVMNNKLYGLSESEKRELMFADDWHVNDYGHQLYFESIAQVLKQYI